MKDAEEPSDIFCFRQEYKAWRHSRSKGNRVSIERAFLPDDKLAASGIDVERMVEFRRNYVAFRAGEAVGSSGEPCKAAVTAGA